MITIDKNVPVPETTYSDLHHRSRYPFPLMEVGDSFAIEPGEGETIARCAKRLYSASRQASNRLFRNPYAFLVKSEGNGARCWRVR